MDARKKIVVIGGGNAGLSVAARLLRENKKFDITIVEPSDKHYYQPGWTLVGGGEFDINKTVRNEADYIPKGAKWLKDAVEAFEPENNQVITKSGQKLGYDYLIVCPGIQLNWGLIKGLPETLGRNGVCSNYSFQTAPYTYECIKNYKGGKALFTQPASVIKCGAAPQKIMYLAADNFRRSGIKSDIHFYTGKEGLLRVKEINEALLGIARRYGLNLVFKSSLVEVRGESKEAVFEITKADGKETVTVNFEMMHVVPPMSAPDFIRKSPIAVEDDPLGWVDINPKTLRHKKYGNIFSLGDASNAGDAKTGAAVRIQARILVRNLLSVIETESIEGNPEYDGYTACPLTTGHGKLLLAEFDWESRLKPTFPLDPKKERLSMWLLIKYVLPRVYWSKILTGKV